MFGPSTEKREKRGEELGARFSKRGFRKDFSRVFFSQQIMNRTVIGTMIAQGRIKAAIISGRQVPDMRRVNYFVRASRGPFGRT